MRLKIERKFLVFPVCTLATEKELEFKQGDKTVYRLRIRLDNCQPDFHAYIDVSRFMGQTLDMTVSPEMALSFRPADEIDRPDIYREPLRPQIHFTTKNGWINDPNGLLYLDGVYHLFYQHNPAEPNWMNMHWGHAESRDLLHWEEKDIALFPDERGTMFSGSGILDTRNLLGKNSGEQKTAVLFYTTTEPFCQYMSYSTDGFKTLHRYGDGPVVPHIKGCNRDPKVIFCDELGCYIMALYLDEDEYGILTSENLTDWTVLQTLRLDGDNECPDIFPLTDDEGNRKWVFIGAHDRYLVGDFREGKFVAAQPPMSLHYGSAGYAGPTFGNLPNGRIVRMVFDRWSLPATHFKTQLGIPTELSLCRQEGLWYLRGLPIREIEALGREEQKRQGVWVSPENACTLPLKEGACLVEIRSATPGTGKMTVWIFGKSVNFDFDKNEMRLGDCCGPISLSRAGFSWIAVVDRCSMELFADDGRVLLSGLDPHTVCDYNLPRLTIQSDRERTLDEVRVVSLASIWR